MSTSRNVALAASLFLAACSPNSTIEDRAQGNDSPASNPSSSSSPSSPSSPSPSSTNPTPSSPSSPSAPSNAAGPTGSLTNPLPAPTIRVSEAEMPKGIRDILERRCVSCHTYGERDPAGWGSALDLSRMIASGIVVPGDPDNSRLYNRVAVRADMPYNGARLESAEVQALRSWIANLARPAATTPRTFRELLDVLVNDMGTGTAQRNNDTRYISFNQYVDEQRSPEELLAAEHVLALTLNSLSRRAAIVKLEAVDASRTIFRFRLSQLGWTARDWDDLVSFYPYCLRSDDARHVSLYNRLATEVPVVRGDWFVATATRAPLYRRLVDIPDTLDQLADDLGVDINDDLNHPGQQRPTRVQRIGFRSSGVSQHNRIIDRHQRANGGSLWVSYDFASDVDRADIRANPLGPDNRDARNFQHTFQQAGGEIIFTLPNGLYGYMLVDVNGTSIDLAPKDIVRDQRRAGGAVENGVSCFGCHGVTGMNKPRVFDDITTYVEEHRNEFSSQERTEIAGLYTAMGPEILATDAERYLKALDATGAARAPFGAVEHDDFINLVGEYEAELGLRGAALELGVSEEAARVLVSSGSNEDALPLGLGDPLVTRNDFVCRYRSLVARNARNVRFCAGSFTADEVRTACEQP